jgi:hypothetical protein
VRDPIKPDEAWPADRSEEDRRFIVYVLDSRAKGQKIDGPELDRYSELVMAGAPEEGSVWRHYRGAEYVVLSVGLHSETLQPLVTYAPLKTDRKAVGKRRKVWVRPLSMWSDPITPASGDFDTTGGPARFNFVHGPGGPLRGRGTTAQKDAVDDGLSPG